MSYMLFPPPPLSFILHAHFLTLVLAYPAYQFLSSISPSLQPPPGEVLFPHLSNKAISPKFQRPPPIAPKPGATASALSPPSSQPPPLPPPPEEVVAALSGNQKREILNIERKDLRLCKSSLNGFQNLRMILWHWLCSYVVNSACLHLC